MSEEQLKAFVEKVRGDKNLQEQIKAAKTTEDIAKIATQSGHVIDNNVLERAVISEEDLESVSGGCFASIHIRPAHSLGIGPANICN